MSELDKISELAKAKGLEVITKVNAVMAGGIIGVEELEDVVKTFFDLCELNEQRLAGQPLTVLGVFGDIVPGLLPAVLGVGAVPAEASDLQDEEIAYLVNVGASANLGDNAVKYQQVLKMLLFAIQTLFVFKKK